MKIFTGGASAGYEALTWHLVPFSDLP